MSWGRFRATGKAIFSPDVTHDPEFRHPGLALAEGLRGMFAFPILLGGQVLGVFEFFSTELRPQDEALLDTMASIGSQVGQFIERRRAEQALRESEEKFRGIFAHAGTGIAITDLEGRFQSCNPAYSALLGYSEDELRALNFAEFVHSEDRDANMAQIARVAAQQAASFEIVNRYLSKDAKPIWVHKHVSVLRDAAGRPASMIALVSDITERKQTAELLRESEERLRLALDAAEVGTWHWEVSKGPGPVVADSRCKMLLGLPAGAALTYETWASAIVPGDRVATEAEAARALDPENPCDDFACTYRVQHPHGKMLWLRVKGRAFFEPASPPRRRPVHMAGTVRDVTEACLAEEVRREQARRDRYLLDLERKLQAARSARDAMHFACETLGSELGAAYVAMWEPVPSGEHSVFQSTWSAGGDEAPLSSQDLARLGKGWIAPAIAGETVTVTDIASDFGAAHGETARAAHDALGIRSSIAVPLIRRGAPQAMLFRAASPRVWTDAETALARATLDRAWQAIEKERSSEFRESEERLRHLSDSLPDCAVYRYAHDAGGTPRFLYVSAGIQQLNGVSVEDVLRDADVLHKQIPPDYLALLAEAEQRSARDLSDFKMEVPMRRPDGQVRWMRLRSRPERMKDGAVIWEGVQTDITDQRLAADALRESQERLRLSNEAGGVGDFTIDVHPEAFHIRRCLLKGLAMLRGTARLGSIFTRIHRENSARVYARYNEALRGLSAGQLKVDFRFLRPDGEICWLSCTGRAGFHETERGRVPFRVAGVCVDITDRKQAEAALHESEKRLRLALDAADLGTWRIDARTGVREWDDRCKELFGLAPGAMVTQETWTNAILPEDRDKAEAAAARALDPAQPHDDYACEYRARHTDGAVLWLSAEGRAFFQPDRASPSGRRLRCLTAAPSGM